MKYIIDENICEKQGLPLPEMAAIILFKCGITLSEFPFLYKKLIEKEVFVEVEGKYYITHRYDDLFCKVLLDAEESIPTEDKLEELAISLMHIFPSGKKIGTSNYWRGNKKDIKLKLQKFFKLYGNSYSFDQIIEATKKYVDSFNGDYKFMRILKYFIWKDERKIGADGKCYIEEVSDLASFLENDDVENNNWNIELK